MKIITFSALSLFIALASGSSNAAEDSGNHKKIAGHMFKENDIDKDGLISKSEWQAKGDKMFADADGNHDGNISPDEIKAHHEKKRAEHEARRAERQEKIAERKEKIGERKEKRLEAIETRQKKIGEKNEPAATPAPGVSP